MHVNSLDSDLRVRFPLYLLTWWQQLWKRYPPI